MSSHYTHLYSELCGEVSIPEWLTDNHVLLILDRGASPAGARCLRDTRTRPRPKRTSPWPNPGVYSVPELAQRLVKGLAPASVRAPLSPLEKISWILQKNPSLGPRQAHTLSEQHFARLSPLGVRFEDWKEILPALEQSRNPELSPWTQAILLFLQLEASAEELHRSLSPWNTVQQALTVLQTCSEIIPWARLTERPRVTSPVEFLVLETTAAFPLEQAFLKELARHAPVRWMRPPPASTPTAQQISSIPEALPQGTSSEAIFWLSEDTLPASSEAAEILPDHFLLDVTEAPLLHTRSLARSLFLTYSALDEGLPPHHAFFRHNALHRRHFERCGWDPQDFLDDQNAPRSDLSLHTLGKYLTPSEQKHWENLLSQHTFEKFRAEWIPLFWDLQLLQSFGPEAPEDPRHPRLSPRGTPLLTRGDLGLTGHTHIYLWSATDHLIQLLQPDSPLVLRENAHLPPRLHELLVTSGYSLPSTSEEARLRSDLLQSLWPRLRRLPAVKDAPIDAPKEKPPTVPLVLAPHTRTLSPSFLESWIQCPYRTALERILRFQKLPEWDQTREDPLSWGTWIHKALQRFFENPNWAEPRPLLSNILKDLVSEIFGDHSTPHYQEFLKQRAEIFARELEDHLKNFERVLLHHIPVQQSLCEIKLKNDWLGHAFEGTLDRLDILPSGEALLWDYKTGTIAEKNFQSQLRKGRLQSWLYRELAESPGVTWEKGSLPPLKIVGGGYLNPLDPESSALFVDLERAPAPVLAFFENLKRYPVQKIDGAERLVAQESLHSLAEHTLKEIFSGEAPARPLQKSECQRCSQVAHCGRPYLTTNEDTALEESGS